MGSDMLSLQKVQATSWVLLAVLCAGAWIFFSWTVAWSVFAGGVVSIASFWVGHRDVSGFIESLTSTQNPDEQKSRTKQGKKGYLLRFWIRIVIIGVVLFLLIKSGAVNIFGLILGLSTVVFTITFTALNEVRHYFFSGRR